MSPDLAFFAAPDISVHVDQRGAKHLDIDVPDAQLAIVGARGQDRPAQRHAADVVGVPPELEERPDDCALLVPVAPLVGPDLQIGRF